MNYRMFSIGAVAWTIAGAVSLAPTSAQERADKVGLPPKVASASVGIPTCLQSLTLTPQQQEQVK